MHRKSILIFTALCLLGAFKVHAEEPGFERGYAQALLDEHDATLGLEARATKEEGAIEIAGDSCLPAAQQTSIRQRLTGNGPIVKVNWRLPCAPDQATVAAKVPVDDKTKIGLIWLPTTDIFRPLQADPREPQLALKYQSYDTRGDDFTIGAVQAGETFSLVEGHIGDGTWQVGLQGGTFSIFNQDEDSNDLLNTDYIVSLPLTYRKGNWSGRARIFHISSHLGDEFIANNNVTDRLDVSFEALDLIISHDWKQVRVYGGGGYLLRTTENLDRGIAQAGSEWRIKNALGELDLSLAADYKALGAQDWTINQSYQAALIFTRNKRELRLLLEYYTGKSPNGQFFFNRLDYFGFGFQFGI